MAAGETELTFIRCSNCRSLVPALATRCRMCGNSLGAKTETSKANDDGSEARGRVRQRTISVSGAELSALKESAAEESLSPENVEPRSIVHSKIQEPEFLESSASDQSNQGEPESATALIQDERRLPVSVQNQEDGMVDLEDEEEDSSEEDLLAEGEEARFEEGVDQHPAERTRRKRKRKKKNRRSPLVEGMPELPTESELTSPAPVLANFNYSKTDNGRSPMDAPAHSPQTRNTRTENEGTVRRVEEGMLLGWMVSFSQDPRGEAREIRGGQCFIGNQRLRDSDIVVSEDSISTPHCLLRASTEEGLLVQDLMSERGTFIKRRNTHNYVQCFETARIEHGDWLRLGNFEIMICLLPRIERR